MNLGATFSKVKNWGVHTVADGQLIEMLSKRAN
jgi:hypothetical protein